MDPNAGIPTTTYLTAGSILIVVSAVFVAVRCMSTLRFSGSFHSDDYCSVLAIMFLTASFAVFYKSIEGFTDLTIPIRTTTQYAMAMIFMSGASMWTSKAPVLLLLNRVFGIQKWLRVTCILTLVITGVAILAGDAYNAAKCMPPDTSASFTPLFLLDCAEASSLVGTILGSIGVAADVVIFIIPLPVISQLHLPLHRKIGLALVFLAGILAIVASSVALNYKVKSMSGTGTDIKLGMILTLVESTIVILAGCVPAVKAFWAESIKKTTVYSKLSNFISQLSFTRSSGTTIKRSGLSENNASGKSDSQKGFMVLDDYPASKTSIA